MRRTSSIDMLRPEGVLGHLLLRGAGRDLYTAPDGSTAVIGEAGAALEVAFLDGRKVTAVTAAPDVPGLDGLVGVPAASGFRRRVGELAPGEVAAGSLLHLLLDDVPGAALVSGYAVGAAGAGDPVGRAGYRQVADLCAGFRVGGTIMAEVAVGRRPPVVTGPCAPSLDRPDDPLTWHDLDPLPPHGMRRRRRLDVAGGEVITVNSFFRDSHVSAEGLETVIHEYEVHATVRPDSWVVLEAVATARVLPWLECPAAVGSAGRLAGRSLVDVRDAVREEFRGISTCTHLNDQLRSLGDVMTLARALER
ncbi:DUF2889 domain-containing protein [Streptomyces sp. NPDC007264]|uniref:DUF2889 domain-containing protein n=1 Tax=Streptomyces sp. NPDC007264 TaxID=3364777 RepID=UPI0036D8AA26